MTADQYRSLASDYHWFFDDVDLFLGCDTPGVRAAMAGLEPGARVLDAACGIGIDSAALLRRGFDMAAADKSDMMVEQARHRLRQVDDDGADRVICSEWAELPNHFEHGSFDAIFCVGNSIAHAADRNEMIAAFEAFRLLLAPGAILVLDSYDWELIHAVGSRMMIEPGIVERDGTRCLRTYAWHLPDRFGDPCVLEIGPVFLSDDKATLRSQRIRMYPYSRAELRERLASANFESVALDAIPGDDRYTATGHKPKGP